MVDTELLYEGRAGVRSTTFERLAAILRFVLSDLIGRSGVILFVGLNDAAMPGKRRAAYFVPPINAATQRNFMRKRAANSAARFVSSPGTVAYGQW